MIIPDENYTFTLNGEELAVVLASLVLAQRVTLEGIERGEPGLSGESGDAAMLLLGDLIQRFIDELPPEPEPETEILRW